MSERICDACGKSSNVLGWMRIIKEFRGMAPHVEPVARLCKECNNIMERDTSDEKRKELLMILYLNWFSNLPAVRYQNERR